MTRSSIVTTCLLMVLAVSAAHAQKWSINLGKSIKGDAWAGTYAELDDRERSPRWRIVAASVDLCDEGWRPAKVERTVDTIIVQPEPRLPSCENAPVRYVMKLDGSGGWLEAWIPKQNRWFRSPTDLGLTEIK